jgi:hypothetical protein
MDSWAEKSHAVLDNQRSGTLLDRRGESMTERQFSHYVLTVTGGPGRVAVDVDVEYYDLNDEPIGSYGGSYIAFATTWKDVAVAVRHGLQDLGLDADPVTNVSPMVDLT